RAAGGLSQGGCVTPASMFRGDLLASYLLCPPARPDLPSFPTRRSSDLERAVRISRGSRIRDDPRERGRGTAPVPSRIVAIAVVQQDDGTRSKLAADAHADLLGRHPGVRVPHAERPTEHRLAETSGGDAH